MTCKKWLKPLALSCIYSLFSSCSYLWGLPMQNPAPPLLTTAPWPCLEERLSASEYLLLWVPPRGPNTSFLPLSQLSPVEGWAGDPSLAPDTVLLRRLHLEQSEARIRRCGQLFPACSASRGLCRSSCYPDPRVALILVLFVTPLFCFSFELLQILSINSFPPILYMCLFFFPPNQRPSLRHLLFPSLDCCGL